MTEPKTCPVCGDKRSSLAYARAWEVLLPIKARYRQLETQAMLLNIQRDWSMYVRKLLDFDRVMDWAQTTPLKYVGRAGQGKHHPLRAYLNASDPTNQAHLRWDIYPCACDALKPFRHTSHTQGLMLYHNMVIQADYISFDAYHPLPIWMQGLVTYLEALPYGGRITRELFCSLLKGFPQLQRHIGI